MKSYFFLSLRNVAGRSIRLTSIAASIAHVCGNEAPLVCGRVIKLHRGEVTGPVVSSDHVQQPVNRTHTLRRETLNLMVHEGKKIKICLYVFIRKEICVISKLMSINILFLGDQHRSLE